LRAEFTACLGLGLLRRRGLAAWIRTLGQDARGEAERAAGRPERATTPDPLPAASDITRLIAGIIVAIAMEPVHA
jgi:hypothetical protein